MGIANRPPQPVQGLAQAPCLGPRRNGGPNAASRVTVLEGALRLSGDGDGSVIHPRWHQDPFAATRRRSLQFKVPIQVIDGPQQRRGHRQSRPLDSSCERSHPVFIIPPAWQGLLGRDERNHGPRTLLLFRARKGEASALEDAVQGVVIRRRDRIVLVVVAAGTPQGQPQKRLTHRVDGVLEGQVVIILGVEAEAPGNGQKTRGRHALRIPLTRAISGQQIPGYLLGDELEVRLVGIEGVDDVVPVAPSHRHGIVGRLARGVGIPDHIQPMPPPTLAIAG